MKGAPLNKSGSVFRLRYSYPMMGLGVTNVGASRETDVGILWAAHAQAQGLVDTLADQGSSRAGAFKTQLQDLGIRVNDLERQSASLNDAQWSQARESLVVMLENLRVEAARALNDERRMDQVWAASLGAAVTLVGVGVWALWSRKRKMR